jgi:hypothetical protein
MNVFMVNKPCHWLRSWGRDNRLDRREMIIHYSSCCHSPQVAVATVL